MGISQRPDINQLYADKLRALATELFDCVENKEWVLVHRDAVIEKLNHEVAILKRHKSARRSEQLNAVQGKLLDELIDSDLAAIEAELEQVMTEERKAARPRQKPRRSPLPPELPRTLNHHEPDNTLCQCGCKLKRIGEDISEKLDYVPGEFTVERHIRGKWACDKCEILIQAPVSPQVIDKGIPTAGMQIPRSTIAEWVGEHAHTFLGDWQGKLVCDDCAGYKAGFGNGISEIGCMAHARRKSDDLHEANKSELAAKALEYNGGLYEIERETKDLPPDKRRITASNAGKP